MKIKNNRQALILTAVFVITLFLIIGVPYYVKYIAPFNRPVITVDNEKILMKYFIARTRISNKDPMEMLHLLTNEQIIKVTAQGFGIVVKNLEIANTLRIIAAGGNEKMSEKEYREWYRQQLNNSRLSDAEYRDMIATKLIISRLQALLAAKVPDRAEQYHLHIILLDAYDKAQNVAARLKKGADFSKIASKESIDPNSKKTGGDLGWVPASISNFSDQITSMKLNQISDPVPYYAGKSTGKQIDYKNPDAYYIIKISGKENRKLSEEHLKILKENALDLWLQEEINKHVIKYALDSKIYPWIARQIQQEQYN